MNSCDGGWRALRCKSCRDEANEKVVAERIEGWLNTHKLSINNVPVDPTCPDIQIDLTWGFQPTCNLCIGENRDLSNASNIRYLLTFIAFLLVLHFYRECVKFSSADWFVYSSDKLIFVMVKCMFLKTVFTITKTKWIIF